MAILQFDEYKSKLLALKPTLEELSQALGLEAAEQELGSFCRRRARPRAFGTTWSTPRR